MKKKYLGDVRDLFKYDLIERIIQGIPELHSFSFILMLTQDNDNTDGRKRDYDKAKAGNQNEELKKCLEQYGSEIDECQAQFNQQIEEHISFYRIEEHFTSRDIQVRLYGKGLYFRNDQRVKYFDDITQDYLCHSLVFVDPDNGLKADNPTPKHILYSEVRSLLSRLDDSVLMIYQHFPRLKHDEFIEGVKKKLIEVNSAPCFVSNISDNEICFFLLSRTPNIHEKVQRVLKEYKDKYPQLSLP